MKQLIEKYYQKEVLSIIKKTEKTYLINTKDGTYLFKYVPSHMENIYVKLSLIENHFFLLPLKAYNNHYVNPFNDKFFIMSSYLKSDNILSKDIRLSFYFKAIASLHKASIYPLRIKDAYLDEAIAYLDDKIEKLKSELDARMERVEKEDYHSPSDWFFIMNYQHFILALKEASTHVNKLEEERKKETNLSLSLTYQNFNFDHIYPQENKIVSLDNMAMSPAIYDLYDVITSLNLETISLIPYLKDYFDIYPLKQFEKEWLFALLFIPPLERKEKDLEDLKVLIDALKYINKVEEIATSFYSGDEKI